MFGRSRPRRNGRSRQARAARRACAALALVLGSAGAQPMSSEPLAAANASWWERLGLDAVRAPVAASVTVAIVDTGVDLEHEEFERIPVKEAYVVEDGDSCDAGGCCRPAGSDAVERFHATAVAGLIAAARGNGKGIAGIGTPGRLVSIDALSAAIEPGTGVAAGIECALAKGARLVNVSIQGSGQRTPALEAALAHAADAGVLVVLAAGNGIGDLDRDQEWPAAIRTRTGITVTAVDLEDRLTGQRFGLRSVDLSAPATERIVCTAFPGAGADAETNAETDCPSTATGRYGRFGQTSAAAAMVTGAALLLWSHPNYRDCTAEQVRALLLKHARTPQDGTTRAVLSPFGGVLDLHFLADVVRRDGRVVDLCSGAMR